MSNEALRPAGGGADPRALLDAYLDGELSEDERALVGRALDTDAALRRTLDELRATQALLRNLPPVEPPGGGNRSGDSGGGGAAPDASPVVVALDRARRRRRGVAALIGAIAASASVVMGVGATLDPVPTAPPVDDFASVHLGTADALGDLDVVDVDTVDDPAVLASLGGDMDRRAVYAREDLVHTVYSDGIHEMSVFHAPGTVDWGGLPDDGMMTDAGNVKTWTGIRDDAVVAVTERGDLVVVIVADAAMGRDDAISKATEACEMVPPVRVERDLWERLGAAPGNIVDRL